MNSGSISFLLDKARNGDDVARDALYSKLHDQLRAQANSLMRNERTDHTLQASALVNEACLKLMQEGTVESAQNRRQLFYAAIRAMRQVLIEHARARATQKRGASGSDNQSISFWINSKKAIACHFLNWRLLWSD